MKFSLSHMLSLSALALTSTIVNAAPIFTPGDTIFGGRSDGTTFLVGAAGSDGGNNIYTDNVWPAGESPDHVIDGVGMKYLNFAELNTGFIVTPSLGAGLGTIVTGITFWTANDAAARDPSSYSLFGTDAAIAGPGPFALSDFTLISSGGLALPATRQPGGIAVLQGDTQQTVTFANSADYDSYLILFPTVKDEPGVNSMQIGEVQLVGTVVIAPPILNVALAGNSVVLSWSTNATLFNLQSITNLNSPAVWSPVSPSPTAIGDQNFVTNTTSGSGRFYRLKK